MTSSANRPRVLIVEDHALNLELMRDILIVEEYEVLEASDGQSGLEVAFEEKPDLILMDLQMPGVSGLEATRRLREDPRTARIPILAVTAHAMRGDDEKAIAAGCDGFITKPIEVRRFAAEVARILRGESD